MVVPSVERLAYGQAPDGLTAHRWVLTVGKYQASFTEWGAAWVSWNIPDLSGNFADIILGFSDVTQLHQARGGCFGSVCGRYANRIGNARFNLDGKSFVLAANNGPNCNHGGRSGFDSRRWKAEVGTLHQAAYVRFTYISADGEEGFPGELITTAIYTLDHTGSVRLDLRAECEAATVANLTNHAYFNLSGLSTASIGDHCLQVFSEQVLEINADTLPTGRILSVEESAWDFRKPQPIGNRLLKDPALVLTRGYDHTFIVQGEMGQLRPAAIFSHPASGRAVKISTTAPALVLYTGNWLKEVGKGALGKAGKPYDNHSGVALETQNYPDAPNHPHFPSARVDATHPFVQTTVWEPSLQA